MWVEVKHSSSNATLVGYVHRILFRHMLGLMTVEMMDKVNKNSFNVVLLGDFNTDLLKYQPAWESIMSLFGLHQLICCVTMIMQIATCLHHFYVNDE